MTRDIHIHVEEPSMEAYLIELLPRLGCEPRTVRIINHASKMRLLSDFPKRLLGYARIPLEYRPLTLVLIDRDNDDCHVLKQRLEEAVSAAGLVSKTSANTAAFDVVNRIVIEELEAWHFGDVDSLAAEYPGISTNLGARRQYRDPDAIEGGTHEALLRVLQAAGYHRNAPTLPKVDTARRLARRNNFVNNRSASFQQFRLGLSGLMVQQLENQEHG